MTHSERCHSERRASQPPTVKPAIAKHPFGEESLTHAKDPRFAQDDHETSFAAVSANSSQVNSRRISEPAAYPSLAQDDKSQNETTASPASRRPLRQRAPRAARR